MGVPSGGLAFGNAASFPVGVAPALRPFVLFFLPEPAARAGSVVFSSGAAAPFVAPFFLGFFVAEAGAVAAAAICSNLTSTSLAAFAFLPPFGFVTRFGFFAVAEPRVRIHCTGDGNYPDIPVVCTCSNLTPLPSVFTDDAAALPFAFVGSAFLEHFVAGVKSSDTGASGSARNVIQRHSEQ